MKDGEDFAWLDELLDNIIFDNVNTNKKIKDDGNKLDEGPRENDDELDESDKESKKSDEAPTKGHNKVERDKKLFDIVADDIDEKELEAPKTSQKEEVLKGNK